MWPELDLLARDARGVCSCSSDFELQHVDPPLSSRLEQPLLPDELHVFHVGCPAGFTTGSFTRCQLLVLELAGIIPKHFIVVIQQLWNQPYSQVFVRVEGEMGPVHEHTLLFRVAMNVDECLNRMLCEALGVPLLHNILNHPLDGASRRMEPLVGIQVGPIQVIAT